MTIRWLLAAVQLLALGVGLGAVWARGRAAGAARRSRAAGRLLRRHLVGHRGTALDRYRRRTGIRRVRERCLLLSPQPPLLGEDGAARRDSPARARPDDRPDSLARCRGSPGLARHPSR